MGLQGAIGAAQAPLNSALDAYNQSIQAANTANAAYQTDWASGDSLKNAIGAAGFNQAKVNRDAAQQYYTNLNNQLSGTVNAINTPTPQTIPGAS